jgi:putative ABC transport system substrate-binding protein
MNSRLVSYCLGRREVIAGLGSFIGASSATAQSRSGITTIGFLIGQGLSTEGQWRIDAFAEGLRRRGLSEGRDFRTAYGWGRGGDAGNASAARDLVALSPAVLVANNTQSLLALREAAGGRIPIVFVNVSDPVEGGFIDSLARPGGMITGFTDGGAATVVKWVELLHELSPAAKTVALIHGEPMAPFVARWLEPFRATAGRLDLAPVLAPVENAQAYAAVMERLAVGKAVAIMADDPLMTSNQKLTADLAREHRLLAIWPNQGYVITYGGLLAYGVGLADLYIQAMEYVDRILKGAKPADLPVQLPARYRLAINLKTADAIGLAIPPAILARADRLVD